MFVSVAFGAFHYKVVCVGNACGALHILHGGSFHAKCYIVEEAVVKEYRLLVYIAHKRAQSVDTQAADIGTVDAYRAAVYVVEARYHVGKGTLAAAPTGPPGPR